MSILNVEHLSHGFGDRAIFQDVSFRLLKGEHIGLVGANGEGKSTFMSIITGKLQPDEGKVEWAKHVRAGYLDQHTVLEKGMTIRDVLKSAFAYLFEMEEQMNHICDNMGNASEEEMNAMMEELGTIQDLLMAHDFYIIDSKVEEVGRALGLQEIGMDKDVSELSGGQRTKVLLGKLLLEKPDILLLDEPTNYLDEQHTMDGLDELLGRADIVAMVLPGGDATNHIMDERRLRLMKKGAYLINVGRGNAVDPEGLYKVLKEGHLGGCGLDVTEPEPLPADSPLWDLGNLVITPHVAGNFFLPETFERIVRIAGENLAAWANGTPYRNVVDFATGYRK